MKQFAVYFIPDNAFFYKKGSEIIGYDIIKKLLIKPTNKYTRLSQVLNDNSKQYGFHLTLTDVVDIDGDKINRVINRVKFIFNLPIFKNLILKKNKVGLMPNANVLAIQYKNNFKIFLLHLLLIIFVQRVGKKSIYSNNLNKLSCLRQIKTNFFLSPYIINDFFPHITIVSNMKTVYHKKLQSNFTKVFNQHKVININKIAVVVKDCKDDNFKVKKFIIQT